MSVLVFVDAQTTATAAATMLAGQLIEKPSLVLGVDCAESLAAAFQSLRAMTANGLLNWDKTTLFQLSERVLGEGTVSMRREMEEAFYGELALNEGQVLAPAGVSENWAESCRGFENAILNAGGLDVALITVHPDGSVLFNVADGEVAPITHVELYKGEKIVTAGLSTLMAAKKLIVLMTGQQMAETARQAIKGAVNTNVPASLLQLHAAATFLLDEDAASLLG